MSAKWCPKPILDGWELLDSTAIYRSAKRNPFFGEDAEAPSIGQIMLMSKQALQRKVLRNPHGRARALTIQRLLTLQGTMKPSQLISLMSSKAPTTRSRWVTTTTTSISAGSRSTAPTRKAARRMAAVLKPDQWIKLISRISEIDNPVVGEQPSKSRSR